MAQVVLVYPETELNPDPELRRFGLVAPLSCIFVAAMVVKNGRSVKIIDQRTDLHWADELKVAASDPETVCVGISSMTGPQIGWGLKASEIVKSVRADLPVVWGGVHPTLRPEECLSDPRIDYCVLGEGELTFADLVEKLVREEPLGNMEGVAYVGDDGSVVVNERPAFIDLNDVGIPPYHLVDHTKYTHTPFRMGERSIAVLTSRGCPFRCAYCYSVVFDKRRWRPLTAENTVAMFEHLVETYNTRSFVLLDDMFVTDVKRVRAICEMLREKNLGLTIHNANIRIDAVCRMDQDLLNLMREVGFTKIFVGAESGSDEILKGIDKDSRVKHLLEGNRKLQEAGIVPVYAFMAGFPFEKPENVKETLRTMAQLHDDNPTMYTYGLSLFSPFPGTRLFDLSVERGMRAPKRLEDWCTFQYNNLNYIEFPKDDAAFFRMIGKYSPYFVMDTILKDVPGLKAAYQRFLAKSFRRRVRRDDYEGMWEFRAYEGLRSLYHRLRDSRSGGTATHRPPKEAYDGGH
ncbi:MAG: B12-binding domain-containing radical SAM protein [Candidatus Methylomirabilis sp.]|nr:B12-binding domain-containing radical SAM protein [Deltaproteobacteria bacterium]